MYIFQLVTNDASLQLSTEATEPTLSELHIAAAANIQKRPEALGHKYRIWEATRNDGGFWVADAKDLVIEGTVRDIYNN